MEQGIIIAFNKEIGKGFIKNDGDHLYYLFSTIDCIDDIKTNQLILFNSFGNKEAIEIKLRRYFSF